MPFHADIKKWCDLKPNAKAVSIGDETFSFQTLIAKRNELNCRVFETDARQSSHQIDAKVIALVAENSLQFISQFLSATYWRNCCFLLSSALKASQIKSICEQVAPDIIFPHPLFGEFEHSYPEVANAENAQFDEHQIGENDDSARMPFLIGLTSGTTSQPKAFIRSRLSWQSSLLRSRATFNVDETTTTISPGPLAHGLSLYALAETLSAGAHFVSMEKFDAGGLVKLALNHSAKRLVLVPTMLSALCRYLETEDIKLDQITSIVSAGSKLDGALLQRANQQIPNAPIFEYYGASELGFITYALRQSGDETDVGKAFPGVELAILDADGNELPAGQSGKVCVKSDLICDGYLSQQDDVGFTVKNGWASVGDIGSLDTDGKLTLAGREGDMIISGGNNIYPSSIETVLAGLSNLENCAVLGMEDAHLGSRLIAVVAGENLKAEDLHTHCLKNLPSYAVPKAFYSVKTWPMTESGKISKKILMDWVASNHDQLRKL
ncbi:MAG: AMP-binding protein [Lentilitoribacter sp.]